MFQILRLDLKADHHHRLHCRRRLRTNHLERVRCRDRVNLHVRRDVLLENCRHCLLMEADKYCNSY